MLCVNIQRLKLSRNPWSCGVCCIALSRTSSPGGGCSPGPQGGARGPELLHLPLPLGHLGTVTTVPTPAAQGDLPTPSAFPDGRTSTQTQRGQHQGSPQGTDTASRGRAWEDPEAKSVNLEPKLLGSVSCKFRIYRRLCCSHHTMTLRSITSFVFCCI